MRLGRTVVAAAWSAAVLFGSAIAATYDVHDAEVISVNDNRVIVREGDHAFDYTVGSGASFTADGAPGSLSVLRPGMKVSGTLGTTEPVRMSVVDLRGARVAYTMGGHLIVAGDSDNEYRDFTDGTTGGTGILIYRAGQIVPLAAFVAGDKITAAVVTKLPPKAMSGSDVETFVDVEKHRPVPLRSIANTPKVNRFSSNIARQPESAPTDAAGSTGSAATAPAAHATTPPATAPPATEPPHTAPAVAPPAATPKSLPKTAGAQPVLALAGLLFAGLGAFLTLRRRLGTRA
ncbi:MAG TPA: LPXTG cell wall anchor domain-containing protein [Candidatus Polarisedimenticolaceae bacterium]|nr:LPXTG cell wall anchor domain-containing protein [Candidatus Polarisedimenticolaceae bacterium]